MIARLLGSTLAVLSVLAAFGCQPDCRLVCEEFEEADCYNGPDTIDCEYDCKHREDLVRNAGCQADYDAVLICLDSLEDICDAVQDDCSTTGTSCKDPKCDNEQDELTKCLTRYCTRHPRNNECSGAATPTEP